MRVHYLQHVSFEGLGSIEAELIARGHQISVTRLYLDEDLPSMDQFDWLIVMGGPMGIYDEAHYPWISSEKLFIKAVIDSGKIVLGICLGAQFIADALGVKVGKNKHKEIGWFPLQVDKAMVETCLSGVIQEGLEVFHWHGDTFSMPESAANIASSEACRNQGFIYNDRVVGFQFHLETTFDTASLLIENARADLDGSLFVQTEDEMLGDKSRFAVINKVMSSIISRLEKQ